MESVSDLTPERASVDENDQKSDSEGEKSALQHSIDKRGNMAYYYAHAHKADGPKWDGKVEPKLLSKRSSSAVTREESPYDRRSNITSYAFSDEDDKVRLYIVMKEVGKKCTNGTDITLDFTESSMALTVRNYEKEDRRLVFRKLLGKIKNAKFRTKDDQIVVTLFKNDGKKSWDKVNSAGGDDDDGDPYAGC